MLTAAANCPVRCSMHSAAAHWVAHGNVAVLQDKLPVFGLLRRGVWRHCTCRMWERIQEVLVNAEATIEEVP